MTDLSGKDKFLLSFVSVHMISLTLSAITFAVTDLLTALIGYLIYIHVTAALLYIGYERYQINLKKALNNL